MSKQQRIAVIMAGGSGERFWPLSRTTHPKQLLHLNDPQQSLLSEAVTRLTPLFAKESIYVATSEILQPVIAAAELGLPAANIIAEPCKRNTSGCLAYAAATALHRHGGDPAKITMAVVTADHRICNADGFRTTISTALQAAECNDAIVTIGIVPSRAETGYGYIEMQPDAAPAPGTSSAAGAYNVRQFREKPDADTANAYMNAGHFFWNSGMFFWRLDTFINELKHATPPLAEATLAMAEAMQQNNPPRLREIFAGLDNISIDYALLEKARHVLVAPASFEWDDVGAWDALERAFPADANGNISVGNPVMIDSRNSIVYNAAGSSKAVAVVGIDNLVVVVADDAVLVVPKDQAQNVKAAVEELKKRNSRQL